jgi:tetratricopeptide (TPR) repeat protein
VILASCLATALATASLAQAQTQPSNNAETRGVELEPADWVQGLSELTAAVVGTYGDEGPRIGAALDKMARGLAEWDRAIQALEGRLAAAEQGASSRAAFDARVTLARAYVERGRLPDAARELELASGLEPQRADLHLLRGLVLQVSNRSSEAGGAFRAAWAADSADPINAYHVFRHAAGADQTRGGQRARDALERAYQGLLRDATRTKASPFVALHSPHDSAAGTPVLRPAAYARGYDLLASGHYGEAIAEFRDAAARDPLVVNPAARSPSIASAVVALRQGRPAEARTFLDAAAAAPGSPEGRRVLGMIYWVDSQEARSIEQLEAAVRGSPRDERSRLVLARVLTSAGRVADAQRILQETIRLVPDSALAHWWLASNHELLNQFADARREFELAAAGAVAGQSQLHASIGRLAGNAGDFAAASDAFARAVNARPNDAVLRKSLAGTLLQQDRADEAFVELVAALLIDPLDAGAHTGIGQIFVNAQRYEDAAAALRRAVALAPDLPEARYALATALMRSGEPQAATRELVRVHDVQRRLLADRRRSMAVDVLKEEAVLRAAEGHYDRAIERLEAAAKLQGPDPLLGIRDSPGAIRDARSSSAVAIDPEIYRRLAELYAKVGRVEDASRAAAMYTMALEESPARGTSR